LAGGRAPISAQKFQPKPPPNWAKEVRGGVAPVTPELDTDLPGGEAKKKIENKISSSGNLHSIRDPLSGESKRRTHGLKDLFVTNALILSHFRNILGKRGQEDPSWGGRKLRGKRSFHPPLLQGNDFSSSKGKVTVEVKKTSHQ